MVLPGDSLNDKGALTFRGLLDKKMALLRLFPGGSWFCDAFPKLRMLFSGKDRSVFCLASLEDG